MKTNKTLLVFTSVLCATLSAVPIKARCADDVLTTKFGAPLKVISRHDTATFAEPAKSSRSQPVRQFEFYYVLPATDGSSEKMKDEFYRISTDESASSVVGWMHKDDVLEWPHRLVLGLTPLSGREPAFFFGEEKSVLTYLSDGSVSNAISREPAGGEVLSLLPILEERTVDSQGEETKVYRVAYLHTRDPKNTVALENKGDSNGALSMSRLQSELTLDIAFVVDATGSMGPWIDGAKTVIRRIAAIVNGNQNLAGRVRLALVCYRDTEDDFTSEVFCTFEAGTDLAGFEAALDRVVADGGGDDPEQVFAGVQTAIADLEWNDVANRHLILIGDAPSHSGDKALVTLESVLSAAQPTAPSGNAEAQLGQITIHTLRVGDDDSPMRDVSVRQFGALAAGRDLAGKTGDMTDVSAFVDDLTAFLSLRISDEIDATEGRFDDIRERKDPHAGALGAVLEYMGDEELLGPTFASGYVGEIDASGNRTVEPYVLVTHNQLRSFNAALHFCVVTLEGAGSPGSRDVNKVLKDLQILSTQTSYSGAIDTDTPLSEVLSLILGLPVKTPIFAMTPGRLAAMTQSDFDAWVHQVEASQKMINSHIENAHWFHLGRETRPERRHAFIKVTDMP